MPVEDSPPTDVCNPLDRRMHRIREMIQYLVWAAEQGGTRLEKTGLEELINDILALRDMAFYLGTRDKQ